MSKTDNTRPYWVQNCDTTLPGEVNHWCTRNNHRKRIPGQVPAKVSRMVYLRDEFGVFFAHRQRGQGSWVKFLTRQAALRGRPVEIDHIVHRASGERALLECDYDPRFQPKSKREDRDGPRCRRNPDHYGGERWVHGHAKAARKTRRRKFRQRERAQCHLATQLGPDPDIDILPKRYDARTVLHELS